MTEVPNADFPLRINVSFLLSEEVLAYALAANATIADMGGEFMFLPDGRAIPHITMLMGEVGSSSDLKRVIEITRREVRSFAKIKYYVSEPYRRDAQGKYIFIDTNPQSLFYKQRKILECSLSDLIRIDRYGGADNVSHVTLGYVPQGTVSADISILGSGRDVSGVASSIQIALTGPRGTCIETLAIFEIGSGTEG